MAVAALIISVCNLLILGYFIWVEVDCINHLERRISKLDGK